MLADAEARLGSAREARWLVEEAAPGSWPGLLDEPASERGAAWLEGRVARRQAGEPLQYVIGHWPFRTLDLLVDRRVLIPRPETEQVVDVALAELAAVAGAHGGLVADLGTGSGAIALSVAAERPGAKVWATDASADAVAVAGANLAGLGGRAATQVSLCVGDWWEALPSALAGQLDLVVSNPPYVTAAEMADLDPVVADWEPATALDGGPTGTDALERVVAGAVRWLRPGGALVVELGPSVADATVRLARSHGLVGARVLPDLAGRPRTLVART